MLIKIRLKYGKPYLGCKMLSGTLVEHVDAGEYG